MEVREWLARTKCSLVVFIFIHVAPILHTKPKVSLSFIGFLRNGSMYNKLACSIKIDLRRRTFISNIFDTTNV